MSFRPKIDPNSIVIPSTQSNFTLLPPNVVNLLPYVSRMGTQRIEVKVKRIGIELKSQHFIYSMNTTIFPLYMTKYSLIILQSYRTIGLSLQF